jgi:hypothetical protein
MLPVILPVTATTTTTTTTKIATTTTTVSNTAQPLDLVLLQVSPNNLVIKAEKRVAVTVFLLENISSQASLQSIISLPLSQHKTRSNGFG